VTLACQEQSALTVTATKQRMVDDGQSNGERKSVYMLTMKN